MTLERPRMGNQYTIEVEAKQQIVCKANTWDLQPYSNREVRLHVRNT